MVLEDFLFPGEVVVYRSPFKIKYLDDEFELCVTNQRFIAFQGGKKERIFAERFRDISTLRYREQGRIFKREGILTVETLEKYQMKFSGKPSDIRALWKELEGMGIEKRLGTSEIVPQQTRCKFCAVVMRVDSLICPRCRRIQK